MQVAITFSFLIIFYIILIKFVLESTINASLIDIHEIMQVPERHRENSVEIPGIQSLSLELRDLQMANPIFLPEETVLLSILCFLPV
jgi:hypothetical protein